MKFIKKYNYFLINEARQLIKAPFPILIALIMPLIAWFVLAFTFYQPMIENIPCIIIDNDNSAASRLFIRNLNATQAIEVNEVTKDENSAINSLQSQKANFVIFIEKDFEKNIKTSKSGHINVLSNGAVLMYSKIGYRAIAMTAMTMSAGIQVKRLTAKGMTFKQAFSRAVPITTEINTPGNPYFNYGIYLIPAMLLSILQMSASFSCLWVFRQHREHDSGRILPMKKYRLAYFIGRFTPLFLINTIAVLCLFFIFFPILGVQYNNSVFLLFLLTLFYMLVSMLMGAFLSIFLTNLVTSSQVLLVINAPAFVFSGYTYPMWAMPDIIAIFSNIFPFTHYMRGFLPMYLFNTPTSNGIIGLSIMFIVLLLFTLAMIGNIGDWIRDFEERINLRFNKELLTKK